MFDRNILGATLATLGLIFGLGVLRAEPAAAAAPLSCEITAAAAGGMLNIAPVVHAPGAVSGTYQLTLTGSGVNISQGGPFAATGSATLGQVMLGAGGRYTATLHVTAAGATATCTERLGG